MDHLPGDLALSRVVVFTRMKRGANQIADAFDTGGVQAVVLHGNKSLPTCLV